MRNVIVTGGSRGLGLAIARLLATEGYRVVAVARRNNEELAAAMEDSNSRNPGSLHFVSFDLAETSGIGALVRTLRKDFGPIYGLVNNAGISIEGVLSLAPTSEIEKVLQVNTLAPIVLTKYVVRSMMADGGGRIVNIASVTAFSGYSGLAVYSATKASMIGFSRSLAREVGRMGVNVNSIAPGFIDTEMTKSLKPEDRAKISRRSALGRLAEACDVAGAVAYLLSDAAKNVTGTVLTVDAGATA